MHGSSPADVEQPDDVLADESVSGERRRPVAAAAPEPIAPTPAEESTGSPDVGATVLAEVQTLVEERRFSDAARVLESLERLRPDDPEVLALIAITHANAGRNRTRVREALKRLSTDFGALPVTWRAVGDVALARSQFGPAQHAARTSVQMSPRNVRNWHLLAAAYAGNGWFDEAAECIAEAKRIDPIGRYRSDNEAAMTLGHWQIGRAVNQWAITGTHIWIVGVVAFFYIGLLGLALALSAPALVREIRVRSLPEPFNVLGNLAWRAEHRLRVLNALAVLGVLTAWVVVFSISR